MCPRRIGKTGSLVNNDIRQSCVQEGDKLPRGSIKLELKKLKLFNLQTQLRSQVCSHPFGKAMCCFCMYHGDLSSTVWISSSNLKVLVIWGRGGGVADHNFCVTP